MSYCWYKKWRKFFLAINNACIRRCRYVWRLRRLQHWRCQMVEHLVSARVVWNKEKDIFLIVVAIRTDCTCLGQKSRNGQNSGTWNKNLRFLRKKSLCSCNESYLIWKYSWYYRFSPWSEQFSMYVYRNKLIDSISFELSFPQFGKVDLRKTRLMFSIMKSINFWIIIVACS